MASSIQYSNVFTIPTIGPAFRLMRTFIVEKNRGTRVFVDNEF